MIPVILVSNDKKEVKSFLDNYIKQNNITAERIFEIYPLKKEIVISQIRELKKNIAVSTTLARLYIFHEFNKTTVEAQNAFLKSLEDDSIKNQFILLVENEYTLLPTIRSRSVIIKLKDKNTNTKNEAKITDLMEKVENTLNYKYLAGISFTGSANEEVTKQIELIIKYYRSKLASESRAVKIIKKALNLKALLDYNNLNPQLTYDNLLIFISKAFRMKI